MVEMICYKLEGRKFESQFFQFTYSFRLHHGPGAYSASNRNEYQKIFGGKVRPVRKADNVAAIY
jgi:hypothetical protein